MRGGVAPRPQEVEEYTWDPASTAAAARRGLVGPGRRRRRAAAGAGAAARAGRCTWPSSPA
ncbi:hypothetical protein PR202_ga26967 [Eleusine coracana subsp. coracana]|uniref:Uncharacterized protein n=1 Tax=Eleusine coracana subsp. coracana TaxID=191504 RepID=A0AAV5DER9_ELECO|nr:hypothetical protein PR202_ga26967 [Eleusine coracana subsp. coracana]